MKQETTTHPRACTNVLTLPYPDVPAQLTLPVGSTNPVLFWRAVMQ